MTPRPISHRPPPAKAGERGATLVEYAMLVALVAIVLLGALQYLTDESSDELEARADRSGSPDLDSTGVPAPPSGGGGSGGGDGGSTTPPITVSVSSPTGCWAGDSKNWTANFTIIVTDAATGAPVNQAIVTAKLTRLRADGTVLQELSPDPKETLTDGTAPFSVLGLDASSGPPDERTGRVVFELVNVTGVDPPINFTLPSPPPSATADRNNSAGACP